METTELPINEEQLKVVVLQFIRDSKIHKYNYKYLNWISELLHVYARLYYPALEHWVYTPMDASKIIKRIVKEYMKTESLEPNWKVMIQRWNDIYTNWNNNGIEENPEQTDIGFFLEHEIYYMLSDEISCDDPKQKVQVYSRGFMDYQHVPEEYYLNICSFMKFELLYFGNAEEGLQIYYATPDIKLNGCEYNLKSLELRLPTDEEKRINELFRHPPRIFEDTINL